MSHFLTPARQPGESFEDYKRRRRWGNNMAPVNHPAEGYAPGPHRSHQPRQIQVTEKVAGAAVARAVVHPGTLVKVKP